ncbi:hypothetical protein [Deinococcus sp. Marseille-Q6407]|uniref:hypothetical protein n=1 Tax=Deinococcus sp. Marseille-Q6407 TaxID=2969223 RepID=UPI0021C0E71A|nr:hypothetical protein [Deinococcus sp. Marseille-Q6407]
MGRTSSEEEQPQKAEQVQRVQAKGQRAALWLGISGLAVMFGLVIGAAWLFRDTAGFSPWLAGFTLVVLVVHGALGRPWTSFTVLTSLAFAFGLAGLFYGFVIQTPPW